MTSESLSCDVRALSRGSVGCLRAVGCLWDYISTPWALGSGLPKPLIHGSAPINNWVFKRYNLHCVVPDLKHMGEFVLKIYWRLWCPLVCLPPHCCGGEACGKSAVFPQLTVVVMICGRRPDDTAMSAVCVPTGSPVLCCPKPQWLKMETRSEGGCSCWSVFQQEIKLQLINQSHIAYLLNELQVW